MDFINCHRKRSLQGQIRERPWLCFLHQSVQGRLTCYFIVWRCWKCSTACISVKQVHWWSHSWHFLLEDKNCALVLTLSRQIVLKPDGSRIESVYLSSCGIQKIRTAAIPVAKAVSILIKTKSLAWPLLRATLWVLEDGWLWEYRSPICRVWGERHRSVADFDFGNEEIEISHLPARTYDRCCSIQNSQVLFYTLNGHWRLSTQKWCILRHWIRNKLTKNQKEDHKTQRTVTKE